MAATNPGRVSLIAWWSLDEESGNAIDAWGANDLTDTNTVLFATGKVSNARDFELANVEYFTLADNTDLSTGDIDFTFGCWVNMESQAADMQIMAKWTTGGNQREYRILYQQSTNRLRVAVSADGIAASGSLNADTFGAVATGTWYFVVAWHDSVNNLLGISVNGTSDTTAYTTGVFNGTSVFDIGAFGAGTQPFDGLIDEAFLYKKVLTADQREWLYNSGNGRAQSELAELQTMAGAVTPAGTLVNKTLKVLSGALTSAGVVVAKALKALAGAITPSGVVSALFLLFMRFFAQPDDWTFAAKQDEGWAYDALPENWAFKVKDDTNG